MKIAINRSKCIGCGSCAAVCQALFELGDDGLALVKGGETVGQESILEVDQPGCAKESAEVCPVQAITVE